MAAWLHEVDPSGALLFYLTALEDRYESVEQVIEVYVLPETACGALDPQFFADAQVCNMEHQQLFVRWFATEFGVRSSSGSGDPAGSGSPGSVGRSTPPETQLDWRHMSVDAWLSSVHESLPARYRHCFERRFDNVEQILRELHPLRLAEFGVDRLEDRRLFQEWISRWCRSPAPSSVRTCRSSGSCGPDLATVPENAALRESSAERAAQRYDAMPCAVWLNLIIGASAWKRYGDALEAHFINVSEIEERFISFPEGAVHIDPSFFQLVGVTDRHHRQRFEEWFARKRPRQTTKLRLTGVSCHDWLRQVGEKAAWARYCKALASSFESIPQIEEQYVRTSGGRRHLDPAFFEIVGVEDPGHQRCFEAWFISNSGLSKVVDLQNESSELLAEPEQEPRTRQLD